MNRSLHVRLAKIEAVTAARPLSALSDAELDQRIEDCIAQCGGWDAAMDQAGQAGDLRAVRLLEGCLSCRQVDEQTIEDIPMSTSTSRRLAKVEAALGAELRPTRRDDLLLRLGCEAMGEILIWGEDEVDCERVINRMIEAGEIQESDRPRCVLRWGSIGPRLTHEALLEALEADGR